MKIVVVNRHEVAWNKAHPDEAPHPIFSVRQGRNGKPDYHHSYPFEGVGKFVYFPDRPLKCGATCWVELE